MVYARYHRYLYATKGHSLEFWSYGRLTNYGIQAGDVVDLSKGPVTELAFGVWPSITRDRAEVRYALPKPGRVMVRLFDVSGRQAAVLADGWHESGRYTTNVEAAHLAQGIYLLKCEAGDDITTRKLIVEK
jgi:hypothetical protein